MTRIYIFLLFCGVFTNVLSQPVDYTVRVIQTQWFENGVGGSCQEGGNEEYSARAWFHDNLNGTNVGGNCITCTNNGNCTNNTDFTLGSRSSTCASSVILRFQAWEDDRGGRCDLNINGGIFDNDDDCHCGASNVATINFRNNGPGCNTYGYYGCNQNNHRFLAEICWNYSAGAPTNTTCGNATTVGVGATAYTLPGTTCGTDITSCTTNDNDALWYAYTPQCSYSATFSTCTGSNYDTAISVWSACTSGQLACNDDACGVQSSVTLNVTEGATYYIRVSGYNSASGNGTLTISAPPIPAVQGFGCNQWNVNVYNGNSTNLANNFFTGYYVENNLNYDSRNRWCSSCSPADASGYVGCNPGVDVHTVVSKRTCFPCGIWRIDVPNHDDGAYLFVNGSQVWSHSGCCDSHNNVWTGFLNNSSTVEFRHNEGGGGSHQGLRFTNVTPTLQGGSVSGNQTLCPGGNPPTITNTGTPSGGAGSLSYQWQQSVGCTGSWSNIGGATGLTYNPPALTQTTCYRRRVTDACGAVRYSNTITITINDNVPPSITCPGNQTLNSDANCSAVLPNYTNLATTSDNCSVASVIQSPTAGSTINGPTNVTLTVTDGSGNTANCVFQVTIIDVLLPTISCPANINRGVNTGVCGATITYSVTSTDNCPGEAITQTSGLASGSMFPIGTTTNEFLVTDAAGNTATCSFDVTITDDEDPTISCPANINQGVDAGVCGATITYSVTSTDNCPGEVITQTGGLASGAVFPIGTTTNEFLVTDAAGNTATCSFDVTISDDEDPTISCPGPITQGVDAGVCGATITYSVTSTDNCPGEVITQTGGLASGSMFPIGTTTNEFLVTDAAGNTATCSFDVTISDDEDPTISCPGPITQGVDAGVCGATITYSVTSTDNCSGEVITQTSGIASGAVFPIGTTTNEFLVTDAAGNTATCSFDVTITDDEDPTISCPANINQGVDAGVCGATITYSVTSTDNCPGEVITQTGGLASGSMFPIGTTTNEFLVTDAAGNTATCSFDVTISDDENPTISCPANINQGVDAGVCGATITYSVTSTDNCPGEVITQTSGLASGSMFPIGTTTNEFLVTDAAGNTATCSFDVTITDDEDPTISCPANITQGVNTGVCGATITYSVTSTDNCPGEVITQTGGLASGSMFPIGTTTNEFLVTDAAGNTATCSFDVTISDDEDPTISCPGPITQGVDAGVCGATITYSVTSTDNCPGEAITQTSGLASGSMFPIGTTTNEFLVTDAAGNTATCSFDVTITDDEDPTISCPGPITQGVDAGVCGATITYSVTSTDNCPGEVITQTGGLASGSMFPIGTTTNEFLVTDAAGNTATCSFDVTISDDENPTISCPGPITQGVNTGVCGATITYSVTSTDNCPGEAITQTIGLASGSMFPIGTTTNEFLVTDAAGNTATCSFDVTITDDEDPTISCPGPITQGVDAGVCGATITYSVTSTDNCPGEVITQTSGLASGSMFPIGTTTNEFLVTDAAGNTATCSFDVTISDDEDPTISCPGPITQGVDAGVCGATITYSVTSTDNCSGEVITQTGGLASGAVFPIGTTTNEFLVTDAAGNTATCSFDVTISDDENPTISCPGPITQGVDAGVCGATITYSVTSTDNCPGEVITQTGGLASGSMFPIGTTTNEFLVTDAAGNTATCSFDVTISDDEDPTISCPGPITQGVDAGVCGATITYSVTSTDNCPGEVITQTGGLASGSMFPIGTTTNEFLVTDAAGNTATCSFDVTISDDEDPTISCPGPITQGVDAGVCGATITYSVTSTDNCPGEVITQTGGLASGSMFPIGTTTNEFLVTDAAGNTATCSFDVTITDDENPTISCPGPITQGVDAGVCGATITYSVTSTDNCPGEVITQTIGLASGSMFPIGTTTNEFLVTDAAGNTATCSFDVTISDDEDPTISCPGPITQGVDAGVCGATITYSVTSTDNCPGEVITQTSGLASGTMFPIGTTTNEFLVTDAAGNTATCSFNVTISDDEDPTISCPANINQGVDAGVCGATITYSVTSTDNCSGEVITQTSGLASGAMFPIGTTTNEFLVTDAAGNTATCSFDVTITDDEDPTISCPANINQGVDAGVCGATITYSVTSTDNCPGEVITQTGGLASGSMFPIGTTTNEFLVTDAAGNTATCSFDVTISDDENPTISCPANINQGVDAGVCGATITYSVTSTDNCPGEVITQTSGLASGSMFPIGTTTNEFLVTDAAGNTATCSFDVTISDDENPTISCPGPITQGVDAGVCGATITYSVTSTDNCPGEIITQTSGLASGSMFPIGTTTNEFLVTDAAGNTATCSFNVTISDDEDPTISCPANINQGVDAGVCGATITYSVTSTDNCPGEVITQTSGLASGAMFPIGTTTNEFLVTDAAGNTATCSFDVTITDDEDPTISCPGPITQGVDAGVCGATITYSVTSTDNCPGEVITQTGGLASGSMFPIGTTTNEFLVTDAAGNTATCSFDVTISDDEDPTISCPGPITQGVDAGVCGATITYSVTSTDNCPGEAITQTSGLASGSMFPIGTTTNEFLVTDAAGNTATCSFDVTISDDEDPTISCPANINQGVDAGVCGATITYSVTSTDNCSGEVITQTSGLASGSMFPIGTTTNEFLVTDAAGNTATCSFDVTITDDEDPTISCPGPITQGVDAGVCGATITYSVTSTDNCPGEAITQTSGLASGSMFPIGTTTNEFLVTDAAGNAATCSFDVTITDDEDPTISCPGPITQGVDAGVCGATITYSVTSTDNCPGEVITQTSGLASGSMFPIGTTTNEFLVTDAAGNTATCSFDVTISDDENPTISCPGPITQGVDAGVCGATITYSVTSTDNCSGEVITQTSGLASGSMFPIGTTTNEFLVTDAAGNTATCSFDVTITDDEDPTISCPGPITQGVDAGVCGATITYSVTSTDNCPGEVITQTGGLASGSMFPIGTTTNEFLVTDAAGNTATCSFDVTISDDEDPTISCPGPITQGVDAGVCGATITYSVTSTDNCPGEVITQTGGLASGSMFPIGTTTNEFLVTDAAGNTATCSFDVTITDDEDPTISCPANINQGVDAGVCGATITYSVTSTDNCSGEVITQTGGLASGSMFPIGTTTNEFLVTDAAGNTATCSFDVTISDDEDPTISCPANINQGVDAGVCGATITYSVTSTDNCPGEVITQTSGLASGSMFPIGTTTNEFLVTDAAGNTATCSFDVTITDDEDPTISCPGPITQGVDAGVCGATITYSVTSTDNCPGEVITQTSGLASGSMFPIGTTTNEFLVTDAAGNTATCSFDVTITDDEDPTISCSANINQGVDAGVCGATITYSVTSTDNCPGEVITQTGGLASGSMFPIGTTTNEFLVTDAAGNTATCSFDVTITDDEDPTISCPANINQGVDAGVCGATITYSVTSTDNCPGEVITQTSGLASGSMFPIGTTTNEFLVTDAAGNTATCSFDVTISDDEDPTISCPGSITQGVDAGVCGATITYSVTSTDNCSGEVITQTGGLASGSMFPIGTTTNEFLVTDAAGNTATCSFDVTITDDEDPTISCPGPITQGVDAGVCGATITYSVTSTDNCPSEVITQTGGLTSGSMFPIGTTTNEFLVTDAAGNTATCSFDVTITDDEDPTISCPANINQGVDAGVCGATITYSVTSTDNCPGEVITQTGGLASGSMFPIGTTTNEFLVTDATGNTATCSFDVTISDDEDPTISCPGPITQGVDAGVCGATITYSVTSTDNCPGEIITQTSGLASGSMFPIGTTTNEFLVTDAAGNTATCSFDVTITDDEDPTISCPGPITQGVDAGVCGATITYSVTSTDNCPGEVITQTGGLASGSMFPIGTTTNEFLVTDAAGNTATCSFDVTISDDEDPTISCPANINQGVDAGVCGATITYSVTSTDNCSGEVITQTSGLASGSMFPIGTTTNEFLVTDAAGNTATCSFDVTISDDEDPTISCPGPITQGVDAGVCGATITYSVTSTDNCPGEVITQTSGLASGSMFPIGTTTNEFLVTDAAGNTATCSFDVTITDDENPTISCPGPITQGVNTGVCGATITYSVTSTDNCPGEVITQTGGLASGSMFPIGTTTNEFLVTDAAGNTATCSFDVTISDDENPTISCPGPITQGVDAGVCGATITYSVTSTDNCPGEVITQTGGLASGSMFPIGTTTNEFLVTDAAGNTATCSFDVTISDDENPTISCPGPITQGVDAGVCGATITYSVTSTDNCSGEVITQTSGLASGSMFPIGTTTNEFLVTDAAGNTATCSFDVTITDDEDPTISCPGPITQGVDAGVCGATITYSVTSTDNCPGEVITQTSGLASGSMFPIGTTTNEFLVTDAAGNTATCSFDVTISDDEDPTISCPGPITQGVDAGVCGATITYSVTSTDNCPGEVITQTSGLASGSMFPIGTTTNEFLVTDAAGNTATCSFDVTISDDEDPVATCPSLIAQSTDLGSCTSIVTYTVPTFEDNCDGIVQGTLVSGLSSGSAFPIGTTTVMYSYTDNAGNGPISCEFDVVVTDDEAPMATCMDITIGLDPFGNANLTPADIDAGSTDNCGIASMVLDRTSFDCNDSGANQVVLTVTDNFGNMSTCSSTVNLAGTPVPAFDCPDPELRTCDGTFTCNFDDLNLLTSTISSASVSGSAAPFLQGNISPGGNAYFDPLTMPQNVPLTLIYTLTVGNCATTSATCTFTVVEVKQSDAGKF